MAGITAFTDKELANILTSYDLGEYQEHKAFEKGADQTNILLITSKGKYAFRYYEKRTKDYVLFEIDLLHHLANHSYPCPAPISDAKGDYFGEYKGKPFAIFEFVTGEHNDSDDNFKEVAKVIAQLHTITLDYKPEHSEVREGYDTATVWHNATTNAAKMQSQDEANNRLDWLRAELDKLNLPDDMPKGTVHGDTNPTNFLYSNGQVSAVLDFDQASYTHLLYDLANLIYWWTWPNKGDVDFDRTRTLIASYETVRQLSETEKSHLFDMLKLCICVGIGWFIYEADFPNNKRKIELLNSIGSQEFYQKVFGNG